MKRVTVFVLFLTILNSCNKCPNYQWYFNEEIGIRICDIDLTGNDFIEIKGSVLNKSSESIKIGWLRDINKENYSLINKNRPVLIDGDEAVMIIFGGLEVLPNEEVDLYWRSYDREDDKEQYRSIKKANSSESYFTTSIENFKSISDTTIKINY